MADSNLALLITAAGYGINILVLGIIAAMIWGITKLLESNKTN
jgi:Na+-transporting methylmalonyl-CoA/oxaloacetate decarboxylase gamma subunit